MDRLPPCDETAWAYSGKLPVGDWLTILDENGEVVIDGEVMAFSVGRQGNVNEICLGSSPRISWLRKYRRWRIGKRSSEKRQQRAIKMVESGEAVEVTCGGCCHSSPTLPA
jgi:hypothetical protein